MGLRAPATRGSIGHGLGYTISTQFHGEVAMPGGLLAPAYMAFALPRNSALRTPLDRTLVRVTANPGWRSLEDSYFER